MKAVRATATGIELDVWVTPRAAQPGLGPLRGDRLRAAVSAPPVAGEANAAVRVLVAKQLGVARGQVAVLRGATGRNKTLAVSGDSAVLLTRAQDLYTAGAAGAESRTDGAAHDDNEDNDDNAAGAAAGSSSKRKGSKR